MKRIPSVIVFLFVSLATSVSYGDQPPRGVAGVEVVAKRSGQHAVTDARGNFSLGALPGGTVTLSFRARKAADLKSKGSTADRVIVATSYSITIEGTKRGVNKSGLTSDDLLAGYEIKVEVGAGAAVHGQVTARALKNMVWISKEPGSNLPGRWVEEGSPEHKAAIHYNAHELSVEEVRQIQR